ncbi:unnamed protein product [Prunus armeniaca]|uniref:Uncharacterized protein n=1 Tax=Prunus armeniaca TaxID=36596 RepID=A0A6J5V6Q5_PRUAR|nr:unnamed protein product [Prunus armeniaca]
MTIWKGQLQDIEIAAQFKQEDWRSAGFSDANRTLMLCNISRRADAYGCRCQQNEDNISV